MIPCWFTVIVGQGVSLIVGQVGQVIAGHGVGSSHLGQSCDSVVTGGGVLVGQSHAGSVIFEGQVQFEQLQSSVGGFTTMGQIVVGQGVESSHVGQTHSVVTGEGVLVAHDSAVAGSSQVGQVVVLEH